MARGEIIFILISRGEMMMMVMMMMVVMTLLLALGARRGGRQSWCDGRSPPSGRRRRRRRRHRRHRLLLWPPPAASTAASAASTAAAAASAAIAIASAAFAAAPYGSDEEGGDACLRVAVVIVHSIQLPRPRRAAPRVEMHRAHLAGEPNALSFPVGLHTRPDGQRLAPPRQEAGRLQARRGRHATLRLHLSAQRSVTVGAPGLGQGET